MRSPMPFGCLSLIFFLGVLLFPFFLANVLLTALNKLGFGPGAALLVAFGIFFGGLINIPVARLPREHKIEYVQMRMFGLSRIFPVRPRHMGYTIIAINVGGGLVPLVIALFELFRLSAMGLGVLLPALAAVTINIILSYILARPVPGVGIAMPALVPGLVAAAAALLLAPEFAPPVAFAAGVLGPLVGADLFHLNDIKRIATGTASIGGAGTFDGIVISALLATLLA
jgi:uncharacterized membrane protein